MEERQEAIVAGHRVRRARALIAALDAWIAEKGLDSDPVTLHQLAQQLPHKMWVEFAETHAEDVFGRRPPSPVTVAMAVSMLESRRAAEETFHRRTHGNFRRLVEVE